MLFANVPLVILENCLTNMQNTMFRDKALNIGVEVYLPAGKPP